MPHCVVFWIRNWVWDFKIPLRSESENYIFCHDLEEKVKIMRNYKFWKLRIVKGIYLEEKWMWNLSRSKRRERGKEEERGGKSGNFELLKALRLDHWRTYASSLVAILTSAQSIIFGHHCVYIGLRSTPLFFPFYHSSLISTPFPISIIFNLKY